MGYNASMNHVSIICLFDKSFLYKTLNRRIIESLLQDLSLILLLKEKSNDKYLSEIVKKVSHKELTIWFDFLHDLLEESVMLEDDTKFKIIYKNRPERFLLDEEWNLELIVSAREHYNIQLKKHKQK